MLGACSEKVSYDWPEGDRQLFVSHIKEPIVSVIDENQVQAELELPFVVSDMLIAGDQLLLSSQTEDNLYALNLKTQNLAPLGKVKEGITKLAYDGEHLYAALADSNEIVQMKLDPFTIEKTVKTDAHPHSMTFAGTMLYVTNVYGHTVQAIDTTDMTVKERFRILDRPNGIAWINGGLVVGGHGAYGKLNESVYHFSLDEKKTDQTVETGLMPIEVIQSGSNLLVLNHGSGDVVKLDAATLETTGKVTVGANPYYGIVSNGNLYVSSMDADIVSEIDIKSFTVTNEFPTTSGPHALALEEEDDESSSH